MLQSDSKIIPNTFCDLFTTTSQLCLNTRMIKIDVDDYCTDVEEIRSVETRDGRKYVILTYEEFVNLKTEDLANFIHIGMSSRDRNPYLFYHIALILAIMNRTHQDKCEPFLERLVSKVRVDPYFEITDEELSKMIRNGELDAYLYTVGNIFSNPNVNLIVIEYEIRLYKELVETLMNINQCDSPNAQRWPHEAGEILKKWLGRVYRVRHGDKTYTVRAKDRDMFDLLSVAQDNVRCNRGQYYCADEPVQESCSTACKPACDKPKSCSLTISRRCRRKPRLSWRDC